MLLHDYYVQLKINNKNHLYSLQGGGGVWAHQQQYEHIFFDKIIMYVLLQQQEFYQKHKPIMHQSK
jgi:hypothetical protein